MLRDYRNQSVRHQTLAQARRVLTHSSHMVRVLEICGIDPSRIRHIPHTARGQRVELPPPVPDGDPIRLVFVGRIVREKGLHLAISSLPMVSRALRREVCFEVLGSGPDQQRCERLAANVSNADVAVCFRGWLSEREVMEALRRQHLLLCPSIWPEPFGQVGLEGATLGLPSVAFDVGGISEWLVDGVNGALVSPRGDFSRRLAEGIIGAVDNPEKLECLRQGALKIAQKFTLSAHLDALDAAFAEAIRR